MLTLKNLNIHYDNKIIIENGRIDIPSGALCLICGVSGTGKTTVLNYIAMNKNLSDVEYDYNEEKLYLQDENNKALYKSQLLTTICQESSLFNTTVEKNLKLFYAMNPKNTDQKQFKKQINTLLKTVNLDSKLKKRNVNQLSGGEKKRVAIACALAKDTPIILLDEPDTNLDPTNQMMIADIINHLVELKKTVVIVTHHEALYTPDVVYRIEDYQVKLEHGNLVDKTTDECIHSGFKQADFLLTKYRYKFSQCVFSFLISFGLALACVCGMMGIDVIGRQIAPYQNLSSQELLVENAVLSDHSDCNPIFTSDQIEQMNTLTGVIETYPYYTFNNKYPIFGMDGKLYDEALSVPRFIDKNGKCTDLVIANKEDFPYVILAFDAKLQENQILNRQSKAEKGIYLSQTFVDTFGIENIENTYLKLNFSVPITTMQTDFFSNVNPEIKKARSEYCVPIELTLPILGIKQEDNYFTYTWLPESAFYMDYHDMEAIMSEAREGYQMSLDNYPLHKENKEYPILEKTWQPSSYIICFEEGTSVESLTQEIRDIDEHFVVRGVDKSINLDYIALIEPRQKYVKTSLLIALITITFVAIVKMYLKMHRNQEERELMQLNGINVMHLYSKSLAAESVMETIFTFIIISLMINKINRGYQSGGWTDEKFIWWTLNGVVFLLVLNFLTYLISIVLCWIYKRKRDIKC